MKKFIQIVVLQVILGLVVVTEVGAVGCGTEINLYGETEQDIAKAQCDCPDSPVQEMLTNYGDYPNFATYCCGFLVDNHCLSTPNPEAPNPEAAKRYELCSQIPKNNGNTTQYNQCIACREKDGVWTALGCISSNPEDIIGVIETAGLGLAGSVVLIMIIVGAFKLSVSQGDPNKTKEAKDTITSAIIGLLFIIFSVTILQFIGVSVLHIPGFGE